MTMSHQRWLRVADDEQAYGGSGGRDGGALADDQHEERRELDHALNELEIAYKRARLIVFDVLPPGPIDRAGLSADQLDALDHLTLAEGAVHRARTTRLGDAEPPRTTPPRMLSQRLDPRWWDAPPT